MLFHPASAQRSEAPRILDFSTTTSPLGVSENIRQAVREAAEHLEVPQDAACRALCRQIGESEEVDPAFVYCGADTADLIWRLVEVIAPRKAIVPAPTYGIYETALSAVGCRTERCLLWESSGFAVGRGFLDALTPETDCVFLCQPNNPTGLMAPQQILLALIDKCARLGIYLILDECFLDFLENPLISTEKPLLKRYPNLILLKSPSVTHGMAGLKLAYCLTSNAQLRAQLYASGRPCTVSNVAQAAGIAALQDTEYAAQARSTFAQARSVLHDALENAGATVLPGEANYLLFRTTLPDLAARLAQEGLLVKDCADCAGLAPGYCRVSLRTLSENARLAQAVSVLLRENPAPAAPPAPAPETDFGGETIL
ncbi:MAG: aminotransferase class I/II-fold pyridoxal phosphate-dependent enzyme [Faecalibacterium sp.]|jgi:threonine-phosphate decarboxylase|nr:aminotransferase class I/II-fold pyridoxal phosphate-dependent enzyme [Faecalibacterium sp.]